MSSYDFVQHGQQFVDSGQYHEAVKVCRLGLLAHPTALVGRLVLGQALLALRRHDEVLAEMRVALEIEPSNARALALKGEALLNKGDVVQAAQVLNQAYAYAPADRRLAALCMQAESMLATANPYDLMPAPIDDMTKHYPAQRSREEEDTSEGLEDRRTRVADPLGPANSFDDGRRGMVELDDDTGEAYVIEELTDARRALAPDDDAGDSSEMTQAFDEHDMVPRGMRPKLDVQSFQARGNAAGSAPERATAAYRKVPDKSEVVLASKDIEELEDDDDDLVEQETLALELPRGQRGPAALAAARAVDMSAGMRPPDTRGPGAPALPLANEIAQRRTALAPAQQSPVGAPPPAQRGGAPPAMDELFPNDETGISRIAQVPQTDLSEVVAKVRSPNPSATVPATFKPASRRSADMRVIRAGLGLDPERGDVSELKAAMEGRMPVAPSVPAPPAPMMMPEPRRESPPPMGPVSAPVVRTESVPRRRSPVLYGLYAAVALVVVAAGVFAGFKIREIRLDREIRSTQRDAMAYAQNDTYDGYLRARAAYAGIVSVRSDARTRSSLARIQAAIAFEFGDGYPEAKAMVGGLRGASNIDAAVARAYLALAEADLDIAKLRIGDVEQNYPDEPIGPYLRGRVALLEGKLDDAVAAFDKALKQSQRPLIYVGLGRAKLRKGAFSDASAALERALSGSAGNPDALIARAEIVVATGVAPKDPTQPDVDLEAIIGAAAQDGGTAQVSQRQRAQAALVLASLKLVRKDDAAANKALERVRELMPEDDRFFSRDLIRVLLVAGDTEAAKAEADRAVKQWPDAMEARVALAQVALLRNEPQEVLTALDGDLGGDAMALTVRGRAHLMLEDIDKAGEDLTAALAAAPSLVDAAVARADLDLFTGDVSAALMRIEPIYNADAPPEVGVVYAAALRHAGKLPEARRVLERLQDMPRVRRVSLEMARLERAEGNFAGAEKAYVKAVAEAPGNVPARLEAALLALDIGNIAKARAALEELAQSYPTRGSVLVQAARVLTLSGLHEKAAALLDTAEKLPAAPRWLVARERGRLALRRGERSAMLSYLSTARSLKDSDPETRLLLLSAQLRDDDLENAGKTVEDVLKQFARGMPVRDMARGRFNLAEDRLDEAMKAYKQARATLGASRASPREIAEVEYWMGRTHFLANRLKEARRSFATAVVRDPGHADAHFYLALSHHGLEQWQEAEDTFKRSLELDPAANPEGWYYLGEARFKRKRRADARRAFETYLERAPDGYLAPEAREYLDQLR